MPSAAESAARAAAFAQKGVDAVSKASSEPWADMQDPKMREMARKLWEARQDRHRFIDTSEYGLFGGDRQAVVDAYNARAREANDARLRGDAAFVNYADVDKYYKNVLGGGAPSLATLQGDQAAREMYAGGLQAALSGGNRADVMNQLAVMNRQGAMSAADARGAEVMNALGQRGQLGLQISDAAGRAGLGYTGLSTQAAELEAAGRQQYARDVANARLAAMENNAALAAARNRDAAETKGALIAGGLTAAGTILGAVTGGPAGAVAGGAIGNAAGNSAAKAR